MCYSVTDSISPLACSFLSGGMSFRSVTNDSIKSLSSSYEMFLKCRPLVNTFKQNRAKFLHIRHVLLCLLCLWLLLFPATIRSCQIKSSKHEVLPSLNLFAEISHQNTHIICYLLSQNMILNVFLPRFSGKKKNSLGFLILSANTHLKLIYVKY